MALDPYPSAAPFFPPSGNPGLLVPGCSLVMAGDPDPSASIPVPVAFHPRMLGTRRRRNRLILRSWRVRHDVYPPLLTRRSDQPRQESYRQRQDYHSFFHEKTPYCKNSSSKKFRIGKKYPGFSSLFVHRDFFMSFMLRVDQGSLFAFPFELEFPGGIGKFVPHQLAQ